MTELKPCPFCGPKDAVSEDGGIAHCFGCHGDVATDDWQSRPIEDALRAEVARLQAHVETVREQRNVLAAEVANRKEAQEKDGAAMRMATAELSRRRLEVAALKAKLDKANERAEQAGAEWTRARAAWRRRGDLVRSAFFAEDFDCLDQFFGGGDGQ